MFTVRPTSVLAKLLNTKNVSKKLDARGYGDYADYAIMTHVPELEHRRTQRYDLAQSMK